MSEADAGAAAVMASTHNIFDAVSGMDMTPVSAAMSTGLPLVNLAAFGFPSTVAASSAAMAQAAAVPALQSSLGLDETMRAHGVLPDVAQALGIPGSLPEAAPAPQMPWEPRASDEAGLLPSTHGARRRYGKRFESDEAAYQHTSGVEPTGKQRHGLKMEAWAKRHERSRKNIRVPWSPEETQALERGVRRYATSWAAILKDGELNAPLVAAARSSVDLKDKWRNWSHRLRRGRNPLGWVACREPLPADLLPSALEMGVPIEGTSAASNARNRGGDVAKGGRPRVHAEPGVAPPRPAGDAAFQAEGAFRAESIAAAAAVASAAAAGMVATTLTAAQSPRAEKRPRDEPAAAPAPASSSSSAPATPAPATASSPAPRPGKREALAVRRFRVAHLDDDAALEIEIEAAAPMSALCKKVAAALGVPEELVVVIDPLLPKGFTCRSDGLAERYYPHSHGHLHVRAITGDGCIDKARTILRAGPQAP